MSSTDRSNKSKTSSKTWKCSVNSECNMEPYIEQIEEIYGKKLTGQVEEMLAWYKEFKSQHNGSNLNKLSFRRRCRLTPNADEIKARELDFINDAIPTEKRRTKYKDIIPPYSATKDSHCKAYFKRPDIKRLVTLTCSPRSPRVK